MRGSVLLAVVLVSGLAHAQNERRSGRVVRVERRAQPAESPPQFFSLTGDSSMGTYGRAPKIGSELVIVNADGVQGTAVLTSVAARDGGCRADLWEVGFRARWELEAPSVLYTAVGVQGLTLGPRARLLDTRSVGSPAAAPEQTVWVALDRDGDELADVVVTAYACEDAGFDASRRDSRVGARTCVDVHVRDTAIPAGWRRVARDAFAVCR